MALNAFSVSIDAASSNLLQKNQQQASANRLNFNESTAAKKQSSSLVSASSIQGQPGLGPSAPFYGTKDSAGNLVPVKKNRSSILSGQVNDYVSALPVQKKEMTLVSGATPSESAFFFFGNINIIKDDDFEVYLNNNKLNGELLFGQNAPLAYIFVWNTARIQEIKTLMSQNFPPYDNSQWTYTSYIQTGSAINKSAVKSRFYLKNIKDNDSGTFLQFVFGWVDKYQDYGLSSGFGGDIEFDINWTTMSVEMISEFVE